MEMQYRSLTGSAKTVTATAPNGTDRPMTIAIKSRMVLSAVAVFLGLAVASPAAWAFADQTDSGTHDIDKEDAELGDYSAWTSRADGKDTRSGVDLGWTIGPGRPAGTGKGDARTPADAGPSAPGLPANPPEPGDGK